MANATFVLTTPGSALTATNADDLITLERTGASGTFTVSAGGGTDTVVFDGFLGATGGASIWESSAANQFTWHNAGKAPEEVVGTTAAEYFQFDNGTISINASVTPETLLAGANSDDIDTIGGTTGTTFNDLSTLLNWDGSTVTNSGGWMLQSVEGQTSIAGGNITVLDGGVVQGRVTVNGTNDGFEVSAENSFHAGLDIGEAGTMDVDFVLVNGADTFAQTVTVDVIGVASDLDNTYHGTEMNDGKFSTGNGIDLLGGNDTGFGNGGDDVLFGNSGNDKFWAGATDMGDDTLIGGDGDDILAGGEGNDLLIGNDHDGKADFFSGTNTDATKADGSNTFYAGDGDDVIAMGGWKGGKNFSSKDVSTAGITDSVGTKGGFAYGGDGDDAILGTATGDDKVYGNAGKDTFVSGDGNSTFFAGPDDDDADTVEFGKGDNTAYLGAGDDILTTRAGSDGKNEFYGDDGNDTFTLTGDGNNTVYGGTGVDTATVTGDGNNLVDGGDGTDGLTVNGKGDNTVSGGAGGDTIAVNGGGGTGNNSVTGGDGADNINVTSDGDNSVDGGADDDVINVSSAGTGTNTLSGGDGDDTLTNSAIGGKATFNGGTGDDVMFASGGSDDTFVFGADDGTDTINGFLGVNSAKADKVDLSGTGATALTDLITVDTGTDFIIYYGDNDSITMTGYSGGLVDAGDFLFA